MASALTDLMPYALIATEQSIHREDFVEAQRLYALMEKADAQRAGAAAPEADHRRAAAGRRGARRAATKGKTEEDAEAPGRTRDRPPAATAAAQQQAAQQLAAQQAADQQAATQACGRASVPPTASGEAAAAATAQPRSRRRSRAPAPAQPAPASRRIERPACAVRRRRRVIRRKPARRDQSGEVQVEFTVGTDGSVTTARVVRANPPRVFDREAVAAVRRWRFQPVDAPVTTRRTIGFNPRRR